MRANCRYLLLGTKYCCNHMFACNTKELCRHSISRFPFFIFILICVFCSSLHIFEDVCITKYEQNTKGGINFHLDMSL